VAVHLSNDATQKHIRQVKWIPPLDNIIKVNVDGSSFIILEDPVLEVLLETIMVIGCWVFLDFMVLLLAWRPNCMPFFMAFALRMMQAT